jgi:hypothetical protein
MRRGWQAGLAAAGALLAPMAPAAEPDLLQRDFFVSLGTFTVNADTDVRLAGEAGSGTPVDFDRTFGDEDTTRLRLDAYWRFADRHKLRAIWFDASTDATRNLDAEIDWGDETFPVGAAVTFESDFSIYEVAYEYAFMRRESFELTGSAGLHWTQFEVTLSATLDVEGEPGETRYASDSAKVDVPLPVFGLRGLWNPGGNFWVDGSAQYFTLSIDEYDGSLVDYRIAVLWQPRTWFGIGVGYNAFTVDVDVDKDSFTGSLDWTYAGPQVFLSGAF